MRVIVKLPGDPISALALVPRVRTIVSFGSSMPSEVIESSRVWLVSPGAKVRVGVSRSRSTPKVAVPPVRTGISIGSEEGASSSTVAEYVPASSRISSRAPGAKTAVGGGSSSRTVIVWVEKVPRIAPLSESMVRTTSSSSSSVASSVQAMNQSPAVVPAGIVRGPGFVTSSAPEPVIVRLRSMSRGLGTSSSHATARPPAFSVPLLMSVPKVRTDAKSSSPISRVWESIAPSRAEAGSPRVKVSVSSVSKTESSRIVIVTSAPLLPAGTSTVVGGDT